MKTRQLEIVQREVKSLIPYARNARTHSPDQVREIAGSIREYGWTNPVLLDDDNGIIAGHGRILAAQLIGLAEVPCIVLTGLTPQQRKAYMLADNKLALNAGWDEDLLRLEISELLDMGVDMNLTGFNNDEILALLARGSVGLTDPDDAPPLPAKAVSILGDIWLCGGHRIGCMDSADAASVTTLLAGATPRLMVTDPPYGVNYDPSWREGIGGAPVCPVIVKNLPCGDVAMWRAAYALFPGTVCYVWHGGLHSAVVAESLKACKFQIRAQIVWVKLRPALSRGHYHWQHEPAYYGVKEGSDDGWTNRFEPEHEDAAYAVREGSSAGWQGGRKQSTVWMIEHLKNNTGHGTQKPVECMKRPIENNSAPGHSVYEPFLGSGTTLIACEMTGRICFASELSPQYVDVAVERWCAFTGKPALRLADGADFQVLRAALA